MRLVSELRRRNVLRMAALYVVAAWLIVQVAGVLIDLAKLPDWIGTTTLWLLIIGFPIALIFSWFYEITPEGIGLEKDVDPDVPLTHIGDRRLDFLVISLLCAAVILFAYDKWGSSDPPDRSVAVLPFANLSGNPENEYLSDGLSESLLHALAQLPDLKVSARTSSFFFKGQDIDIRDIAGQLGVSNVLEGSVQRVGSEIRVAAQLIEAETGFQLWSQTYDRDMSDIFAVQDDIANSVAAAMRITLTDDAGQAGRKIETVSTKNVAAYEKYLLGLAQLNIRSPSSLLFAKTLFMAALAQDNDFYEARLELAYSYLELLAVGKITLTEGRENISPLISRLLLDKPDDGLALIISGYHYIDGTPLFDNVSFDVDKHLDALSTAIELTPNEPRLYGDMSLHLMREGRQEESLHWLEQGIVIDPLDWRLHRRHGEVLMGMADLDGAAAAFNKVIELNPDGAIGYERSANIHAARKQYPEFIAMYIKAMKTAPLDAEYPASIAAILYSYGQMDEGDKYLQLANEIDPHQVLVRGVNLHRLMLLDDFSGAQKLSEAMLRDDVDNRFNQYGLATMMFMSSMSETDSTHDALAVLEELLPEVVSPNYRPKDRKELALQYYAILAMIQIRPNKETILVLDALVQGWDDSFPAWRNDPGAVAAIESALGNEELAVSLTIENLERGFPFSFRNGGSDLFYRHISFNKVLMTVPAIEKRLAEIDLEASQVGKDVLAYLEAHDLQL